MSATPPTPPEPERPGPAFPGFKMSLGAPERAPTEWGEVRGMPAQWERRRLWPRLVLALGVLIAVALLVWLLLA
jgi:hypothetical protein